MKVIKRICIMGGGVVETDGSAYYSKSAIVEYLHELADYYQEVVFVTQLEDTRKYQSKIRSDLIKVVVLRKSRSSTGILDLYRDASLQYRALKKILDKDTGIIISNISTGGLGAVIMAKIMAARVIYYVGSDPKLSEGLKSNTILGYFKRFGLKIIFPVSVKLCDGILVRGKSTLLQCKKWNGEVVASQPLITYSTFKNPGIDPEYLQNNGDKLNILFVGKLSKNKGAEVLIRAFNQLHHLNQKNVTLTIVGDGDEREHLTQLVAQLGIHRHVRFMGYMDNPEDLITLYRSCDVFVLPTLIHEGYPRVIDEAMACGKPVVCSKLGGMKDGLSEEEVLFVTPGSVDDLYEALKRFSTENQLRNKLEKCSALKAETIISVSAAQQHAHILSENRNPIDSARLSH